MTRHALAHPLARAVAALALVPVLAACSLLPPFNSPSPRAPAVLRELEANASRWADAGITDYRFTIEMRCFCPPRAPADVVVANGVPTSITRDGQPVSEDDVVAATVPDLFRVAREAAQGDSVTITYDPETGVPLRIDADPARNADDEEYSIIVSGFETLP